MKGKLINYLPLTSDNIAAKSYMVVTIPAYDLSSTPPEAELINYLSGNKDDYLQEHQDEYDIYKEIKEIFGESKYQALTGAYMSKLFILRLKNNKETVFQTIQQGKFHTEVINAIDYDSYITALNVPTAINPKKIKIISFNPIPNSNGKHSLKNGTNNVTDEHLNGKVKEFNSLSRA